MQQLQKLLGFEWRMMSKMFSRSMGILIALATAACSGGSQIRGLPEKSLLEFLRVRVEPSRADVARSVMRGITDRYATCHNYRDRGVVNATIWDANSSRTTESRADTLVARFDTLFVRHVGFRFRYFNERGELQHAIWQRGDKTRTWSRGEPAEQHSLEDALSMFRGVTQQTSQLGPSLLFGFSVSAGRGSLLAGQPGLAGIAPISCGKCRVVAFGEELQSLLVVDEDARVVRRFRSIRPFTSSEGGQVDQHVGDNLVSYDPVFDSADEASLILELSSEPW